MNFDISENDLVFAVGCISGGSYVILQSYCERDMPFWAQTWAPFWLWLVVGIVFMLIGFAMLIL